MINMKISSEEIETFVNDVLKYNAVFGGSFERIIQKPGVEMSDILEVLASRTIELLQIEDTKIRNNAIQDDIITFLNHNAKQ